MSRSRLSLFDVDEVALAAFASELRSALSADERDVVVRLLDLDGSAAERVRKAPFAVDVFLASEAYVPTAPVFAALHRAATRRALALAWTSESLALEGRLRAFQSVRDDEETARRVDALLDGQGMPWFLRPHGSTCGLLSSADREQLAERLACLEELPEELQAFANALSALRRGVLCHDALVQ